MLSYRDLCFFEAKYFLLWSTLFWQQIHLVAIPQLDGDWTMDAGIVGWSFAINRQLFNYVLGHIQHGSWQSNS